VAIILVLVYHAYPKFLPGGYIGVDVFFVISGYLISQIIIKQTQKNTFTYKNFYLRRIKRIIPTLLVVLATTLFIVWQYCQLDQTILTLNTLDASLVFGANIQVLLYEKGYFDADMHSNFLLHLWSLGVEEQFYIFWPCILMIVLKKYQNKVLTVLGIYAVSSFILSIVCVFVNQKFAFYFPFCRFWQMAVGGILAYLNFSFQDSRINNALSTVSLVAIFVTSFVIN
jgi:peptidoglycan/LPS O-acetylase OafA/YrhL